MFEEKKLKGKKIAIISTDGFEQAELFEPKKALEAAGAEVDIVSLKMGDIKGWDKSDWGKSIKVDKIIDDVSPNDYDGFMMPGGVINADKLRGQSNVVQFVKQAFKSGKPFAVICHAAWTLIETGLLEGKKMTSWPSLKTDLQNAGVNWVDQEVVVDEGLVTSRKPDDLPAFNKKMIEEFCEGKHEPRGVGHRPSGYKQERSTSIEL